MGDFLFGLIAYAIFAMPLVFGLLIIVRLQKMKRLAGSFPREHRKKEFVALLLLLALFLLSLWYDYYLMFIIGRSQY